MRFSPSQTTIAINSLCDPTEQSRVSTTKAPQGTQRRPIYLRSTRVRPALPPTPTHPLRCGIALAAVRIKGAKGQQFAPLRAKIARYAHYSSPRLHQPCSVLKAAWAGCWLTMVQRKKLLCCPSSRHTVPPSPPPLSSAKIVQFVLLARHADTREVCCCLPSHLLDSIRSLPIAKHRRSCRRAILYAHT